MAESKIGRPRSKKAHEAILNATHTLLNDNNGSNLTIEAIAKSAGVGKPTIYRWWPSLADIVLDVLLKQVDSDIPLPSYETLDKSLRQFLRQSIRVIQDGAGIHLRFLMAQAQKEEEFRKRFREHFVLQRQIALKTILQQAVNHGDIQSNQNLDILVDMIFGTMWYRLLVDHAPLDETLADDLIEMVTRIHNGK